GRCPAAGAKIRRAQAPSERARAGPSCATPSPSPDAASQGALETTGPAQAPSRAYEHFILPTLYRRLRCFYVDYLRLSPPLRDACRAFSLKRSGTWAGAPCRCFRPFFFSTTANGSSYGSRAFCRPSSASTAPHLAHARRDIEGGGGTQTAGMRPGAARPCPDLKVCRQSGRNEARAHGIDVLVASA